MHNVLMLIIYLLAIQYAIIYLMQCICAVDQFSDLGTIKKFSVATVLGKATKLLPIRSFRA